MRLIFNAIIWFLIIIFPESALFAADAFLIVELQEGKALLEAREMPLGEVLEEIRQKYRVKIQGLEHREDALITFSAEGEAPEDVLKRLFTYLGEANYAFEFSDVRLNRVSVLPKSNAKVSSFPTKTNEKKPRRKFANVVQIKKINKNSQAEELGLQKNDLVIEYDGVKITSAQQLSKEVKKRSEDQVVEMTILRDHEPVRFTLNGGLIGIHIVTAKIPEEASEY
ncbi:PDZ domain-containing protein [Desulfonema magnum]|uniref:PDZ domain-containing protein n=1 Tax=Desulfonema magnum TaxID=45655 RepID=A0A975BKL3_9BACT|nr:PDZ domain-containing protein [Desulfonema magnum]QTA87155.1 PDZ domain-containing protein [Desulfonema magnum]